MPVYIISDPDIVKQVTVKEFTNFMDRIPVSTGTIL